MSLSTNLHSNASRQFTEALQSPKSCVGGMHESRPSKDSLQDQVRGVRWTGCRLRLIACHVNGIQDPSRHQDRSNHTMSSSNDSTRTLPSLPHIDCGGASIHVHIQTLGYVPFATVQDGSGTLCFEEVKSALRRILRREAYHWYKLRQVVS